MLFRCGKYFIINISITTITGINWKIECYLTRIPTRNSSHIWGKVNRSRFHWFSVLDRE